MKDDKVPKLKPVYNKVGINYDVTIVLLSIGILILLGIMFFCK